MNWRITMKRLDTLVGGILGDIKHKHTHRTSSCKCLVSDDQLNAIKVKVTVHLQEMAKQIHSEIFNRTQQLGSINNKQITDVDAMTDSIDRIVRDSHWDMLTTIDDVVHPK